jgi:hypothetical protein
VVTRAHYVSSCLVNSAYDLCRSPKQSLSDSDMHTPERSSLCVCLRRRAPNGWWILWISVDIHGFGGYGLDSRWIGCRVGGYGYRYGWMTNRGGSQHRCLNWVDFSPIWLLLLSHSHNPLLFDIPSFVNIVNSTNFLHSIIASQRPARGII